VKVDLWAGFKQRIIDRATSGSALLLKDSVQTRVVTSDTAKHFFSIETQNCLFKRFNFSVHKAAEIVE